MNGNEQLPIIHSSHSFKYTELKISITNTVVCVTLFCHDRSSRTYTNGKSAQKGSANSGPQPSNLVATKPVEAERSSWSAILRLPPSIIHALLSCENSIDDMTRMGAMVDETRYEV